MKPLCKNVLEMPDSGIKEYFDPSKFGKNVISLGVGEPDFKTPSYIRQAAIKALEESNTKYTDNMGTDDLRKAVSSYLEKFGVSYDPKSEILITAGASEGIDLALRAVLNPGDEVLVIAPSYVSYQPCIRLCGGVPVIVDTFEENDFKVRPGDIFSKLTEKTKLLILPYPGNPTGAVMEKKDLEMIRDIIIEKDLYVLSDEIYAELTYGKEHISFASLPGIKERCITINGFSKAFAMTGWRIGMAAAPKDILYAMNKIHQYTIMSVGTVNQMAAIEALTNPQREEEISKMRQSYDKRRRIMLKGLRGMGLSVSEPLGAFYMFPCVKSTGMSSREFCERLLKEEGVAMVPGEAFGQSGSGYVRCSYAYDIDMIKEALKRMERFMGCV